MRLKALSQSSRRRGQPLLPLLILLISRSETGRRSCVERKNRRSIFDPNRKYWTARRSLPRPGNHHVRNRARTSRNWSVSVLCRATPRRMLFYMAPSPWPARLYFHQSHSLKCTCPTLSVTPTPGLRKTTTTTQGLGSRCRCVRERDRHRGLFSFGLVKGVQDHGRTHYPMSAFF